MGSNRLLSGDLWIVQLAEQISSRVSRQVHNWKPFDKFGLGNQLTRAVDSIGLNISEGYARAHLKERLQFFSIAEGSMEEALFAIRQARERELLSRLEASILCGLLLKLGKAQKALTVALKN